MWKDVENRIDENDRDNPVPLRRELLAILRNSGLEPSGGDTKKMVSFTFGADEPLTWELTGSAINFFVRSGWLERLENAGLSCDLRKYQEGLKDGGRHSALSRSWSFSEADCICIRIRNAADLRKLLDVLGGSATGLSLNPQAVTRWISRLRRFFPDFVRFDAPDEAFDERERTYKIAIADELRAAVENAETDKPVTDAIYAALVKSNLIQWRAYWALSPKGDADMFKLSPAFRELAMAALGPAAGHPQAVASFVDAWTAAVPDPQKDHARQIGEFVLMHLSPNDAIYIRHTVRQDLWREAVGTKFPVGSSMAETYQNELKFMEAVRDAFRNRGLAPRDMIDVQSALWVIHNYGDDEMSTEPEEAMVEPVLPVTENLILYGPPGTGKTFATAWEAVRLCLGDEEANHLREDRVALMTEYRRLANEGRIKFVTFHQSFSYEGFVEGLRPVTNAASAEDGTGGEGAASGFSLKPHAGVFKQISEKARLNTGDAATKRLDRSRSIYKISLGKRGSQEDRVREGLENSSIHIGWGGDIDWSDERFEDFSEIRKEWNLKKDGEASGKDGNIAVTYTFRSALQIDDYVVIADGVNRYRAFGRVTGEYEYDQDAQFHPHRRKVEWIWQNTSGADRADFYPKNFTQLTAYQLDPSLIDWDALEKVVIGPTADLPVAEARPHVLIIDEINRANISKVFGELITLLEPDKRLGCQNEVKVQLPYSGMSFGVPPNLHIVGTMNTADRSIALLDTALRRRFTFREMMPDISALKDAMSAKGVNAENVDGIHILRLLTTLNKRIEYLFDREHQIGHAYFTGCRDHKDVENVMRHKVIPLLAEYFYDDWSKVAAVLGDAPGATETRFLEATRLAAPAGLSDDGITGDKHRWTIKSEFDFSEFEA
ncbi:MAG TPA: AAA family ATPase [Gammaproteobacteria bacterium]|nr:AAA family ATPase [Gammaproteobacteria bacterium]